MASPGVILTRKRKGLPCLYAAMANGGTAVADAFPRPTLSARCGWLKVALGAWTANRTRNA